MTVIVTEESNEPVAEVVADATLETAIVIADKIDEARTEGERNANYEARLTDEQFNTIISRLDELGFKVETLANSVALVGEATADLVGETLDALEEVEEVVETVEDEIDESPAVVEEVAVVTPEAPQPRQKKARRWL